MKGKNIRRGRWYHVRHDGNLVAAKIDKIEDNGYWRMTTDSDSWIWVRERDFVSLIRQCLPRWRMNSHGGYDSRDIHRNFYYR